MSEQTQVQTQAIEQMVELRDGRAKKLVWEQNLIFDLGLSCHAILVRLYLVKCAGENQTACPSLSDIAAHCSISQKAAKKAIDELIARGLLTELCCPVFKDGGGKL